MSGKKMNAKTTLNATEPLMIEEMANAAGGVSEDLKSNIGKYLGLRNHPYCPSCGRNIDMISGAYRCTNPSCSSFGAPQSSSDVQWSA